MCGIIGLVGRRGYHINQLLYDGLTVLQHRGQDAAGMMTEHEGRYHLRKSNGLVKDVFFKRHMQNLLGSIGIGHVRYPTAVILKAPNKKGNSPPNNKPTTT